MKIISVLLVDDHAVVRAGFRMLLSTTDSIRIVAEAERGEVACQLYFQIKPDVVVLDLSMPGIGGLECIRRICSRDPSAKILVFSVHDESVYVNRAIEAGASGYITKSSAPETLVDGIKELMAGKTYVRLETEKNPSHSSKNPIEVDCKAVLNKLTPKEFDVFCLLAKGLTARKIADELCLGYKTVANYGTQIKTKFNVSSVAELAHIATVLGVIRN